MTSEARIGSYRAVPVGGVALIVILIGFNRVYLGAHYVGDVVGGFAARGAWFGVVITAWEAVRWRDTANRRRQVNSP